MRLALVLLLLAGVASAETLTFRSTRIRPGDGREIAGEIVVGDGLIKSVDAVTDGAATIDLGDAIVTPGLIDLGSRLGLRTEASESRRAISAEMDASLVFDPTAEALERALEAGVTTLLLAPGDGTLIGGWSAAVKPGRGEDDAMRGRVLARRVALKGALSPALSNARAPTALGGAIEMMRDAEALRREPKGTQFWVACGDGGDVALALEVAAERALSVAILGAPLGDTVPERLFAAGAPLVAGPLGFDTSARVLRRVAEIRAAGATLAFRSAGTDPTAIRRGAALAMRHGLGGDDALLALTANAARVAGLEGLVGKIATGLEADFVAWSGEPLDLRSRPILVVIDGRVVWDDRDGEASATRRAERAELIADATSLPESGRTVASANDETARREAEAAAMKDPLGDPLHVHADDEEDGEHADDEKTHNLEGDAFRDEGGALDLDGPRGGDRDFVLLAREDGDATAHPILLRVKRIVPIEGEPIEGGAILIRDGRIVAVGALEVPEGVDVIDVPDGVVTPGFIDASSSVSAFPGQANEQGEEVTPTFRVIDQIRTDSAGLRRALRQGVTTLYVPPGWNNVIGGRGAVVRTAGERRVLRDVAELGIALGDEPVRGNARDLRRSGSRRIFDRRPATRMAVNRILRHHLHEARDAADDSVIAVALRAALADGAPVRAHAWEERDIRTALAIATEYDFPIIIENGVQAEKVVDEIVAAGASVILGPPYAESNWTRYDFSRVTAKTLHDAGVRIAFASRSYGSPVDLRASAMLAVRHGLPRAAALRALTLDAATICGVADRVGAITPGRAADLVVFRGDPLDPSSRVAMVLIDGEIVFDDDKETAR